MKCASKHPTQSREKSASENLLTRAGLRCTKERVSALRTLARLHTPCTVENLHETVGKSINKVTLYRMLEQFADAGLVERVIHPDGVKRYEYQEEHHHHLTCMHCGTRSRVHLSEQKLVAHALASAPLFSHVTSHTAEFFGVCKRCAS